MSTRSIQFFMTREECESALADIAKDLSLHLILGKPGNPEKLETVSEDNRFTFKDGEQAYWGFLAKEPLSPRQQLTSKSCPAEWGWVICTLPMEKGKVLYRADLGCKTDWYLRETRTIGENQLSLEIYQRVVARLRKKLPHQSYIGPPEDSRLKPCKGVRHSQGVIVWVLDGGQLKADGQVACYGIGPERSSRK